MVSARETASCFAFDFEQVVDKLRVHFEAGFDQADIFIAGAEQAFNASADLHAGFHLVGVWLPPKSRKRKQGNAARLFAAGW